MIRSAFLALLLAGCAASPPSSRSQLPQSPQSPQSQSQYPAQSQNPAARPVPNEEVHRGLLTNQKSSPDAPSDSGGPGVGSGGGGRGGL
jgi:hypothetical protein